MNDLQTGPRSSRGVHSAPMFVQMPNLPTQRAAERFRCGGSGGQRLGGIEHNRSRREPNRPNREGLARRQAQAL
eukprot:9859926-Alexandrium_andersonii.AAC.1